MGERLRDPILAVEGVTKRYPVTGTVLDSITLYIHEGELVVIVGPNGSGKTTLVRLVSGLAEPSSGRVLVEGLPPVKPEARHSLSVVLHTPSVYPELTVEENIRYYAMVRGGSWGDADQALKLLGLDGYMKRRVEELSYGWRRRVDIARAFIGKPKLLVIDEPFNGLDPEGRKALIELLRGHLEWGAILATAPLDGTLGILKEALGGRVKGYRLRGGKLEELP